MGCDVVESCVFIAAHCRRQLDLMEMGLANLIPPTSFPPEPSYQIKVIDYLEGDIALADVCEELLCVRGGLECQSVLLIIKPFPKHISHDIRGSYERVSFL